MLQSVETTALDEVFKNISNSDKEWKIIELLEGKKHILVKEKTGFKSTF